MYVYIFCLIKQWVWVFGANLPIGVVLKGPFVGKDFQTQGTSYTLTTNMFCRDVISHGCSVHSCEGAVSTKPHLTLVLNHFTSHHFTAFP